MISTTGFPHLSIYFTPNFERNYQRYHSHAVDISTIESDLLEKLPKRFIEERAQDGRFGMRLVLGCSQEDASVHCVLLMDESENDEHIIYDSLDLPVFYTEDQIVDFLLYQFNLVDYLQATDDEDYPRYSLSQFTGELFFSELPRSRLVELELADDYLQACVDFNSVSADRDNEESADSDVDETKAEGVTQVFVWPMNEQTPEYNYFSVRASSSFMNPDQDNLVVNLYGRYQLWHENLDEQLLNEKLCDDFLVKFRNFLGSYLVSLGQMFEHHKIVDFNSGKNRNNLIAQIARLKAAVDLEMNSRRDELGKSRNQLAVNRYLHSDLTEQQPGSNGYRNFYATKVDGKWAMFIYKADFDLDSAELVMSDTQTFPLELEPLERSSFMLSLGDGVEQSLDAEIKVAFVEIENARVSVHVESKGV